MKIPGTIFGIRFLRALAILSKGVVLSVLICQCGGDEPKHSPWVGTYQFAVYVNNSFQYNDNVKILIGDIPHLFLFASGGAYEKILANSEKKFSAFQPLAFTNSTSLGPSLWSHLDSTITLESDNQTVEEILVQYRSPVMEYDHTVPPDYTMKKVGRYRKLDSKNHDCRKLNPPCK